MKQYFGDPDSAFNQYDHDQAKAERRRPVCDWCGSPIYDDLYLLPDGTTVCEECMQEVKHDSEDYVKEEAG